MLGHSSTSVGHSSRAWEEGQLRASGCPAQQCGCCLRPPVSWEPPCVVLPVQASCWAQAPPGRTQAVVSRAVLRLAQRGGGTQGTGPSPWLSSSRPQWLCRHSGDRRRREGELGGAGQAIRRGCHLPSPAPALGLVVCNPSKPRLHLWGAGLGGHKIELLFDPDKEQSEIIAWLVTGERRNCRGTDPPGRTEWAAVEECLWSPGG